MKVLYFAGASEAAGCREEDWAAAEPMTLEDFWSEAVERHPELAAMRSACRVACNLEYVADGGSFPADAEVAVIPPVSGG